MVSRSSPPRDAEFTSNNGSVFAEAGYVPRLLADKKPLKKTVPVDRVYHACIHKIDIVFFWHIRAVQAVARGCVANA
jgi:hypothetical protein